MPLEPQAPAEAGILALEPYFTTAAATQTDEVDLPPLWVLDANNEGCPDASAALRARRYRLEHELRAVRRAEEHREHIVHRMIMEAAAQLATRSATPRARGSVESASSSAGVGTRP